MTEELEQDRFDRIIETIRYFCEMGNFELTSIELTDLKTGGVYGMTHISEDSNDQ